MVARSDFHETLKMKNDQQPARDVGHDEKIAWLIIIPVNLLCLAIIAAELTWDFRLGEFDVFIWLIPAMTPVFALYGSRRLEVDASGIRLYRRGRLRLERPLSDFSHIQPGLLGISFIVLRDGPWLWVPVVGYEGSKVLDFLATLPQERAFKQARGGRRRPDEIELPVTDIHLDSEFCVGCGTAPDGTLELDASHGFNLLVLSWSIERSVALPGCAACKRRRRWLSITLHGLAFGTLGLSMFGPLLSHGFGGAALWGTVMLLAVVALLFLGNWGDAFIDDAVLGISARSLSRDATRVVLRVRKPGVLRELERNQRTA